MKRLACIVLLCFFIASMPMVAVGGDQESKDTLPKGKPSTHIPPHSPKHFTPRPNIPAEYADLLKAFDTYWSLFISKDFKGAYAMEAAEYREKNPFKAEMYESALAKNLTLKSVKALEVKKTSEKEVMVQGNYYYGIASFKGVKPFTDKWVKEDEAWKHLPTEGQFMK